MILELAYHAIKKILKNFRSVVLAEIGIVVSVCVMFSVFICSNFSKKVVLELLINDTPVISAITCRVKCDQKYQLTLDELIGLKNKKTDEIEQIIFKSESQLSGNITPDFPASIHGAYGKPLDIDVIKGEFLSDEESVSGSCPKIIIDKATAIELFGSIESALYKDIDFVDCERNVYNFCISGVYENHYKDGYDTDFHVYYISFGTYHNMLNGNSPLYISGFDVLVKEYSELTDMKYYLDGFLKSRYHESGKYDYIAMCSDMTESVDSLVNFISVILLICSLIIFIVSGISVRNVIISMMKSYKREIGIKKAVGASESVVSLEYLFQGVIISLTGTIVGCGIMFFLIALFNNNSGFILLCINNVFDLSVGEDTDIKLYISNAQVLIVTLFSVLTVIICCNDPIRESAKMSVVDSIRS